MTMSSVAAGRGGHTLVLIKENEREILNKDRRGVSERDNGQ